MGPAACFDKSFLQSLSVDEAVWFDAYFAPVITPLFFVETLADLEKKMKEGRSAESEVRNIANKTPEIFSAPNVFHATLCWGELLGNPVMMNHRPVLGNPKRAVVGEKKGFLFEETAEAKAFERWRQCQFLELEREYAREWRAMLAMPQSTVEHVFLRRALNELGACKSLPEVLALARSVVDEDGTAFERLQYIFDTIPVNKDRDKIWWRYRAMGEPPIRQFAPYTAHVLDVGVFFQLAMTKGLISKDRPSNRVDIAYLNYLPFCQVFVSSDKLHRGTAPLFLDSSQTFVWGSDLKADLGRIDELHSQLPQEIREKGIQAFAPYPPTDGGFLTANLWDMTHAEWRNPKKPKVDLGKVPPQILEMLKGIRENAGHSEIKFGLDEADAIVMERKTRIKKGKWYLLPKDLAG
jgi:hypothetical protein